MDLYTKITACMIAQICIYNYIYILTSFTNKSRQHDIQCHENYLYPASFGRLIDSSGVNLGETMIKTQDSPFSLVRSG